MNREDTKIVSTKEDKKRILAFTFKTTTLLIFLLVIDQAIKLWVKTHMTLGASIDVFDWFKISFVENPGMAYGIEIGSKLFLTLFRIVAMAFGVYVLQKTIRHTIQKQTFHPALPYLFVLILAGGIGNIIDSVFYGQFFTQSTYNEVAHFTTSEGYNGWFLGHVVDMFYFPLFHYHLPDWVPFIGGADRIFFSPVFNFADSCVSVGLILLLFCFPSQASQALELSVSSLVRSQKSNSSNKKAE